MAQQDTGKREKKEMCNCYTYTKRTIPTLGWRVVGKMENTQVHRWESLWLHFFDMGWCPAVIIIAWWRSFCLPCAVWWHLFMWHYRNSDQCRLSKRGKPCQSKSCLTNTKFVFTTLRYLEYNESRLSACRILVAFVVFFYDQDNQGKQHKTLFCTSMFVWFCAICLYFSTGAPGLRWEQQKKAVETRHQVKLWYVCSALPVVHGKP